jgi:hypothetical protein
VRRALRLLAEHAENEAEAAHAAVPPQGDPWLELAAAVADLRAALWSALVR